MLFFEKSKAQKIGMHEILHLLPKNRRYVLVWYTDACLTYELYDQYNARQGKWKTRILQLNEEKKNLQHTA